MKNDVLHTMSSELRKNPYNVPEGYFADLRGRMYRTENLIEPRSIFNRLVPYMSMAAAFVLVALSGAILLRNTDADYMTYEDYIVHSDMLVSSIYEDDNQIAEASEEIDVDDIINYLIYTGVTAEDIELTK